VDAAFVIQAVEPVENIQSGQLFACLQGGFNLLNMRWFFHDIHFKMEKCIFLFLARIQ